MTGGRTDRRALNETLARDANEAAEAVSSLLAGPDDPLPFRCECGREHCDEVVRVTAEEYETVREQSVRFVVVAGHEDADIEEVVGWLRAYALVEKREPRARELARATDPRDG